MSVEEEPAAEAFPRPDPWKGFRGVCSGVLILEAISVLLGIPVVAQGGLLGGAPFSGPSWAPTAFLLFLAVLLILSCGVQSRSWALRWDLGLQLVLVAGWFLHPAVGVLGLVFVVAWGFVWWAQFSVRKAQRARPRPGR